MTDPLLALIWDFDGTLVDSRNRNFTVARRMLGEVLGERAAELPCLVSAEAYDRAVRRSHSWRDLYAEDFGLDPGETDRIGVLWSRYQEVDDTPSPLFPGTREVLAGLAGYPQGIVSANCRRHIERALAAAELSDHFAAVVGYEEVGLRRQKPNPDGLLACLQRVAPERPGRVLYLGDHPVDFECVRRANAVLTASGSPIEVLSVGVAFADPSEDGWQPPPDFRVTAPEEILGVVGELEHRAAER